MPLIDDGKAFERMTLVFVTEHCTVTANGFAACIAIVVDHRLVKLAKLLVSSFDSCFSLQSVYCSCHLFNEPAIHELVYSEICPAMRTRLALFH